METVMGLALKIFTMPLASHQTFQSKFDKALLYT